MFPFFIGLLVWLAAVNFAAAVITIYDKHQAKINRWRISEKSLLFLSILGGGPGMYFTMKVIRHKTKRKKFMLGIPLIVLAQILLATAWFIGLDPVSKF